MSHKALAFNALSTRDVRRTTLENGLTVLTRATDVSPTVTSMIWYRVGSRHERAGETGRSHFLEHMLFKGTERYAKGEIDLVTMKNGGSNNAFTSYDFTAYYFNFASDRWEAALEIEADRMVNTVFDPIEFDAEKKVVIEELKAGLDHPWGALMQDLNAKAFEHHPYRNPVIGWLPDVEAATVEGMRSHYRRYYHPGNATLVLVGDIETDRALDEVRACFGPIPAGKSVPDPAEIEPAQNGERRFERLLAVRGIAIGDCLPHARDRASGLLCFTGSGCNPGRGQGLPPLSEAGRKRTGHHFRVGGIRGVKRQHALLHSR